MAKRRRVGLVYSYKENWIGGTYYIINIIHALNKVDEHKKPELFVFTESFEDYTKLSEQTRYPYLNFCSIPFESPKFTLFERLINKLSRKLTNKNLVLNNNWPNVDIVYPNPLSGVSNNLKKVYWIPDFQENYLPQFFSEEEIESRKNYRKYISSHADLIVFSSKDAERDFWKFYPESKAESFVLKFAVTHPDFSDIQIDTLKLKYEISGDYLFIANQFWAHKNHIVVLEALVELKRRGIKCQVVMSGNQSDYRNMDNFKFLTDYIETHELSDQINIIGFIPREEQLCLIKHSKLIIQPSLFEGWSTVVEDTKALNKFIIISNLKVHKEQLKHNALFFDPLKYTELANAIEHILSNFPSIEPLDYSVEIKKFGDKTINLINLATKSLVN